MRHLLLGIQMFMLTGILVLSQMTFAQQRTITGSVNDALSGEALPGVTISIQGTTLGTVSDFDGNFTINANVGATLVFSFIGYETQSLAVETQTEIRVALKPDIKDIGEVVIIGYGQVKKEDATGSVASIKADDFNKGAITTPQELITGKSSGVVITSHGGQPGGGATIRIRGGSSLRANNDPLIVIDGFPIDNTGISGLSNALSTINPNDIESMTILKDASATAIYGSRASNGVIIINTKKGKSGTPFKVAYNGNTSVGVPVAFHEVLDGDQYRALVNQRVEDGLLNKAVLTRIGTENTNWQEQIYRNAISMDHNLSMTGNYKNVPYRASIGFTDQNGILKKSNMNRTTLDVSASPSFFDNHLKVNVNLKGIDINNDFSNHGAIGAAVVFDPTQPIMNGNERYGGYFAWTELSANDPLNGIPNNIATHNPVAQIEYRDNQSDVNRLIANLQFDYKFHALPELRANVNMGYDLSSSAGHDYTDPRASWSYREPERNVINYDQRLNTRLLDVYFNYNKDLPSVASKVDVTAGYSWQHFYREGTTFRRPFEMTDGEYVGADTIAYKNENYLVSFFGRVNYTLANKYLFTATVREDGSSRFSKDSRWGFFPSAAFAWKMNEETFLKQVKQISEMKLRMGWGITGQQDISGNYYPYIPTYKISTAGAFYQFGDTFYSTLRPNAYDASIKWEETTTLNIGLDFGFFDNRLIGNIDLYKRTTDDLINDIPIAVATNFSNYLTTNVGSLENKGIETMLTYRPVVTKDLFVEVNGTFTYNKNMITKLSAVNDPNDAFYVTGGISGGVGNTVQINAINQPANSFFLYQQVYDANWMPLEGIYVDRSGYEGSISTGDFARRYFAGKPAPDYLIGFGSKVNYKMIDFSFNARVSIGNYIYNNNASSMAMYDNLYNQSGFTTNLPTSINKTRFKTAQYWSDIYLEDGSFLRIDNINLGYSFAQLFSSKISGRVGLTVQNALVYTKYSGLDPEVNGGIDNNIYPRPRTFVLGLNLNF